jgi:hypothetical protein
MKAIGFFVVSLFVLQLAYAAKDFERFDGQFYNGLYYPLVDIIEWGEQDKELPHIEFHFHSKDKRMDIAVVPGEKGGKPVLWMMYDLKFRGGEKICRHVLAPAHFKEGMKLYTYRDDSDPDYDNIYVYSEPMKQKGKKPLPPAYTMPEYQRCLDENASNMPYPKGGAPEPAPKQASAPAAAPAKTEAPKEKKAGPAHIDYDNAAVPFNF